MAVTISTTRSTNLSLPVAEAIHSRLTRERSDTRLALERLLPSLRGEAPLDSAPDWPMSVCLWADPYTDMLHCVGWVSVTEWDRCLAVQGFVDPEFREKGLATALTAALLVDGVIHPEIPIAVFADPFVRIAWRLRFQDIRRYRQTDDGWLRSERLYDDQPQTAARSGEE